jgi:hypothetical protein
MVSQKRRGALPAETRTYQVLCDTCPDETLSLSACWESGSPWEAAALHAAESLAQLHADDFPGHRTHLLMHTQNTLVHSSISLDSAVRS